MAVPQVIATVPANTATGITIDAVIRFQFNVALSKTTVNAATVTVYDPDTMELVPGTVNYTAGDTIVYFMPRQAFRQNTVYAAAVVGIDSGSGSWIQSTTNDPLASTYRITFRTTTERYVSLEEVADRGDIELVAPIRAVEATLPPQIAGLASQTTEIEIVSSDPEGFESEVLPCVSRIVIQTSLPLINVDPALSFSIETYPALGMEEYLAAKDGRGLMWLNDDCAPTGNYEYAGTTGTTISTPPVFANPTGMFTVTGEYIVWTRDPGEPCFMYNQEVHFIVKADTTGAYNATTGYVETDSEVVFSTKYFPKFIDQRLLRIEIGSLVSSLLDDTMNRIIHKNSIDAWEQAAGNFDIDSPYPAVKRYVKFASMIDVLDAISLAASGGLIGDERKRLGDFEYSRSGGKQTMHPKYEMAVKEKAKALKELRAYRGQSRAQYAVKGSANPSTRLDEMQRTWDNWAYWTLEGLVCDGGSPGANMQMERRQKLYSSQDHHGYLRTTYGTTPNGAYRSVFKCRSSE